MEGLPFSIFMLRNRCLMSCDVHTSFPALPRSARRVSNVQNGDGLVGHAVKDSEGISDQWDDPLTLPFRNHLAALGHRRNTGYGRANVGLKGGGYCATECSTAIIGDLYKIDPQAARRVVPTSCAAKFRERRLDFFFAGYFPARHLP